MRSRVTFAKPRSTPSSSRTAESVVSAQNRWPPARHAPAFALRATFGGGELEIAFGYAGRDVFGEIEHREVPAENLDRAPPLDALCTLVPGDDAPGRVEHQDGVVADTFHEQPEVLLAAPQPLFELAERLAVFV